jgi:hypothetical protein
MQGGRLSHTMDPMLGALLIASPASVTVVARTCIGGQLNQPPEPTSRWIEDWGNVIRAESVNAAAGRNG